MRGVRDDTTGVLLSHATRSNQKRYDATDLIENFPVRDFQVKGGEHLASVNSSKAPVGLLPRGRGGGTGGEHPRVVLAEAGKRVFR